MGAILTLLKFFGIFISGVLGILSLLVNFKEDGKITKWGRRAVIWLVLSFIFSASIQSIEFNQGQTKALEEQAKTQKMLLEINRGIYPLNAQTLSFKYSIDFPINGKAISPYVNKLRQIDSLHPLKNDSTMNEFGILLRYRYSLPYHGVIQKLATEFEIPQTSPIFPSANDTIAFAIFSNCKWLCCMNQI